MIYLNYKLYDTAEDESFLETKKYCEELGYPVILKRNPGFTKKIKKVGKGMGFKTHMPPKFFDYNATERSAGGSKNWRYSLHPIRRDEKGNVDFEGDHGEFLSTLSISFEEYDLEKLWFLLTKSNIVNGRGVYSVHDPEKNYRERAEKDSNAIGVKFYIMSEHSPLSESQLKVVAKYFGIPGVGDMSHAKIQSLLLDKVESLERSKKNGYSEFMKATKLDKFVTFKASLQDAIDTNIIGWVPRSLTWSWLDSDGRPSTMICQINSSDEKNKMDILMDFIMASDELTERFYREIGEEVAPSVDDFDKLAKEKDDGGYAYKELQQFCKVIPGFKVIGAKYPDMVKALQVFYHA